jgi:hypothetical protein
MIYVLDGREIDTNTFTAEDYLKLSGETFEEIKLKKKSSPDFILIDGEEFTTRMRKDFMDLKIKEAGKVIRGEGAAFDKLTNRVRKNTKKKERRRKNRKLNKKFNK